VDKAWLLLPIALAIIYLAAVVAVITGIFRAFRERYLPAWVVGLVAAVAMVLVDSLLSRPLGDAGGFISLVTGICAGAVYGLRQRRMVTDRQPSGDHERRVPGAGEQPR
jgi:hypothetical protein